MTPGRPPTPPRFHVALSLAFIFPLLSFGHASSAADDLTATTQRIIDLEAKLATLRLEVATIERQLVEARQLRQTLLNQERNTPKKYSTATGILRDLPNGLQPHRVTGWDRNKLDTASAWIAENIKGQTFEGNVYVKKVTILENPGHFSFPSTYPQPPPMKWQAIVELDWTNLPYGSRTVVQHVGSGYGSRTLRLFGEDELVRQMKRIRPKQRVRVSGTISQAVFGYNGPTTDSMSLRLTDYTLK